MVFQRRVHSRLCAILLVGRTVTTEESTVGIAAEGLLNEQGLSLNIKKYLNLFVCLKMKGKGHS
jgi:hypothetical protein